MRTTNVWTIFGIGLMVVLLITAIAGIARNGLPTINEVSRDVPQLVASEEADAPPLAVQESPQGMGCGMGCGCGG